MKLQTCMCVWFIEPIREESKNNQGKKPSKKTCGISRTNSQVVGTNKGRNQRTHCHLIFGTTPNCIKISHVNCSYGTKLKGSKKGHINSSSKSHNFPEVLGDPWWSQQCDTPLAARICFKYWFQCTGHAATTGTLDPNEPAKAAMPTWECPAQAKIFWMNR